MLKAVRRITLLAFVAGFVEGEGTITVTRAGKRGHTRPLVIVANTNKQLIDVLQRWWPGQIKLRQATARHQATYTWTLSAGGKIARFLWDILPFLQSDRAKERARLVLADIGARTQGARNLDYKAECDARREAIALLNKRGPLAWKPLIEQAYADGKMPPLLSFGG